MITNRIKYMEVVAAICYSKYALKCY